MSDETCGSVGQAAPVSPLPPLTLICTPIGNLGDLTGRAGAALRDCHGVIAEDTRRSAQLLSHLGISKPLLSFHEHNEERRLPDILARLRSGERWTLVTDAGTPSVSDPGFRLVRACIAEGIGYTVLPGPSAVTTALVGSGLPPVPFLFGGFLPASGSGRRAALKRGLQAGVTLIQFESPHRLKACLEDLATLSPSCRVCVARELTKIHEEYRHGSPAELALHYSAHPPRGEVTLVISPLHGDAKEAGGADEERQAPHGRGGKGMEKGKRPGSRGDHSEKTPILRNLA